MAQVDRINLAPNFRTETLPCDGRVGDLVIISPLKEHEFDDSVLGKASLWVCTKAAWEPEGLPAVWQRVHFDGFATCSRPVALPPQDRPDLSRG